MNSPVETRPRLLIVEDEHVVAADLERSLLDLGFHVVGLAETGRMAVRLAEKHRPEMVLMDIELRGKTDGIAAAEEIVKRFHIPVVFVTANTNDDVALRARASGPYGYLVKPFQANELNATILLAWHQHQLAQQLFAERAWLRTMLGSLSDGVIATDSEPKLRYLNPAAERLTGWKLGDAIGKPLHEVFVLKDFGGARVEMCQLKRALLEKNLVGPERFILCGRDGRETPIEDLATPILEVGGAQGAVSVFIDITDRLRRERKSAEEKDRLEEQVQLTSQALGQTRVELRALSGHLMQAQEEERRRLAGELHDDFGQRTAILEMQAVRTLEHLRTHPSESERVLHQMRDQIAALDRGLREVSHRLHPAVLEDLGLLAGLRGIVAEARENGVDVSLQVQEGVPPVPMGAATALYRIAQEALRNAIKHAPDSPIRITFAASEQDFHLSVEDVGPGFHIDQVRANGGLGLLSMQERARSAGGVLLLKTNPGFGTAVTVKIPFINAPSMIS